MKNTLLITIMICLVMITIKIYTPIASAKVAGMNGYDLSQDYDFKQAVGIIVEDCEIIEDYIDC
ncbi:MAG: hypothetical protein ACKJRS_03760 [Woeseiaceae bacterium]|tara:strand:+ start:4481 stop:4672 length:192 start_codon:yes stop_codon:yes gene_type:complete